MLLGITRSLVVMVSGFVHKQQNMLPGEFFGDGVKENSEDSVSAAGMIRKTQVPSVGHTASY